jgi:hypothetical protein
MNERVNKYLTSARWRQKFGALCKFSFQTLQDFSLEEIFGHVFVAELEKNVSAKFLQVILASFLKTRPQSVVESVTDDSLIDNQLAAAIEVRVVFGLLKMSISFNWNPEFLTKF